MSNLSELLPAGGAAKEFEVVASGTLPNGKPVVLKADGTVEVVTGSSTPVAESIPAGAAAAFNTGGDATFVSVIFDPNTTGKFVVNYTDAANSNYGTSCVGTVSGTTITFGSEYVYNSAHSLYGGSAFDPNTAGRFIVTTRDQVGANYGIARVGTVSGTSISFGPEAVFNSAGSYYIFIAFDPNTAGKFVVAYRDEGNSNYGTANVGTVSGTSISFGSKYVYSATSANYNSVAFDPNTANSFVTTYQDRGTTPFSGRAIVGTISGTSISYGSVATFGQQLDTYYTSASFDPNTAGKFVVAHIETTNSSYGSTVVGSVSGTSISFGTPVVFNSMATTNTVLSIAPNTASKFVVSYKNTGNSSYGTAIVGTISGTSTSFGTPSVYASTTAIWPSVAFDPNTAGKFVAIYSDGQGRAIVGQIASSVNSTNLTTANFAGTATEAFTNGQTATIVPQGGVSTNQTSLTIGSTYYFQYDGTLATSAGTPSVLAGKAISATSLILKGNS